MGTGMMNLIDLRMVPGRDAIHKRSQATRAMEGGGVISEGLQGYDSPEEAAEEAKTEIRKERENELVGRSS